MRKEFISLEDIERWLKDNRWSFRAAAMRACQDRDVPLELIERGLKNEHWGFRATEMRECQGRDVPIELIERGVNDSLSEDIPESETIVSALNHCSNRACAGCPYSGKGIACKYILMGDAASAMSRDKV